MKMNKKVMGLVLAGMMSIGMMTGCSDSTVEEQNNNQMQPIIRKPFFIINTEKVANTYATDII